MKKMMSKATSKSDKKSVGYKKPGTKSGMKSTKGKDAKVTQAKKR